LYYHEKKVILSEKDWYKNKRRGIEKKHEKVGKIGAF
jgi:hypothetical protein